MSLRDRLKIIQGERTQRNFAEEYAISPATYNKTITSGKFINPEFLKALAIKEKVNLTWLLTGQGEPYLSEIPEIHEDSPNYQKRKIPIIGNINSQDATIDFFPKNKLIENSDILQNYAFNRIENISNSLVFLEILGNHFHHKFHDHDLLLIDKSIKYPDISKNAYGIFSLQSDIWVLRRYNNNNGICLLEPLNPDFNTFAIPNNDLKLYGIAIHLFRRLH